MDSVPPPYRNQICAAKLKVITANVSPARVDVALFACSGCSLSGSVQMSCIQMYMIFKR